MPPKTTKCVFCGLVEPASNEDVIPMWIGRELAKDSKPPYYDRTFRIENGEVIPTGRRHLGGLASGPKFPKVCKPCNEGWMSVLEQGMQHAALRAIRGKNYVIDPYLQAIIATWMVKTALLYNIARGENVIPLTNGTYRFYRTATPPPRTQVMIASLAKPEPRFGIFHRQRFTHRTSPTTSASVAEGTQITFIFGQLLIDISINYRDELPLVIWNEIPNPSYRQCWPIQDTLGWPPPQFWVPPADESPPEPPA